MGTFYAPNDYRNYLEHHGIKGMKWGVRRFQNADGSYTAAGRARYAAGKVRGAVGGAFGSARSAAGRAGGRIRSAAGRARSAVGRTVRDPKFKRRLATAAAIGLGGAALAAGVYSRNPEAFKRAGQFARNAATAGAMNARQMGRNVRTGAMRRFGTQAQAVIDRAGAARGAVSGFARDRFGGAASGAARRVGNLATAGAMNARQMGRNVRTGAMRRFGTQAQAVIDRAGAVGGAARGAARGIGSSIGSAASRAGRYAGNAATAGAMNARQAGRNVRTGAMRRFGTQAQAVIDRAGSARGAIGGFARDRFGGAASSAARRVSNLGMAGAMNARQAKRNAVTNTLRAVGGVYNNRGNMRNAARSAAYKAAGSIRNRAANMTDGQRRAAYVGLGAAGFAGGRAAGRYVKNRLDERRNANSRSRSGRRSSRR